MDYHQTEEQQVEALKRWWKENGNSLLIGVGLALAAIFGWKAYQNQQDAKRFEASSIYMQLLEASSTTADPDKREKALATVNLLGGKLKEGYGDTGYAKLGSLILAKHYVDAGNLDLAVTELEGLTNSLGMNEGIKLTAKERLALVWAQKGDSDKAISLLDSITQPAFVATAQEAKGDILLAQGKKEEALDAYKKSKAALGEGKAANALLELKLSHLASEPGL